MQTSFPELPDQLPHRGTTWGRTLCRKIYQAQGWSIEGEIPNFPKAVAIVSPHTSNIDGWYALLAMAGLGLKVTILAKDSLFKPPLEVFIRWLGMIPVDRSSPHGLTEQVVHAIEQHERIWIALAPEGTRKRATKIRSGFYHIAYRAQIPIVMFAFDYEKKAIRCLGHILPTGNYEEDLKLIFQHYDGKLSPKNGAWIAEPLQNLWKKD